MRLAFFPSRFLVFRIRRLDRGVEALARLRFRSRLWLGSKVRDNLYMITNGGGNTAVFITSNGVVLVDTKNPNNGPGIMEHVRAVTNKPVTMVIKTVEQSATEYKIPEKYTGYTSGRGAANDIRIAYTELGGK